ncbi:hypothetical protein Tco_0755149 [Tanacetum coccineum]
MNTTIPKTKSVTCYMVPSSFLRIFSYADEERNVVKGQVLVDFITETPNGESPEEYPKVTPERDDTEEWALFTNGASGSKGSGAGLVLIGPSGMEHTYALCLTFNNTNNEAENYVASSNSMMKYLEKAKEYIACFKSFSIKNIPRNQNHKVDVLNKLASVAFNYITKEVLVEVLNERSTEGKEINTVVEEKGDNWMTPIIRCLEEGAWSEDKNEARNLRVKINQYAMKNGVLFKKSYLVPMLA